MHEFNQSLKYDKRMYAADVKGSIAFSKALLKAGILDESEQKEITRGLKQVEQEWADGKVGQSATPQRNAELDTVCH
jgi:argininosuccinate lyase